MRKSVAGLSAILLGESFCLFNAGWDHTHVCPTIVWSSLIGLAFLEAYEVFDNPKYLEVAASVGEWVKNLPREQTDRGACLSYVPFKQSSIHNSNMLGAALLARVADHTNDRQALKLARDAMTYSCARQNDDGAWFYGEAQQYHWIDNFHTGYNLDCLKRYIDSSGDLEFMKICGAVFVTSPFISLNRMDARNTIMTKPIP